MNRCYNCTQTWHINFAMCYISVQLYAVVTICYVCNAFVTNSDVWHICTHTGFGDDLHEMSEPGEYGINISSTCRLPNLSRVWLALRWLVTTSYIFIRGPIQGFRDKNEGFSRVSILRYKACLHVQRKMQLKMSSVFSLKFESGLSKQH